MTNDFVPFCNENTGTNLPTQSAYLANPNLPIGNQPGIASSSLNNKALRQGSTMAAVLAQFIATQTGNDMLDNQNTADHAIPAALLATLTAGLKHHSPVITKYLSGSGNHNLTYKFQIATGSATAAATYSDGTTTYTVKTTIASGTQLDASGAALPAALSGTLTKTGGTGDATITYYAYRKPLYIRIQGVGGGGGGSGSGTTSGTAATDGGATTFGTTLLVANGGTHGIQNTSATGVGGSASLGTGPVGIALTGASGGAPSPFATGASGAGGGGGSSFFGGAGCAGGGTNPSSGAGATTNSGSGGGGGGGGTTASTFGGGGGGAGGYFDAEIDASNVAYASTYAYAIGAAGAGGAAGGGAAGAIGGGGAAGMLVIWECYQ